MLKTIRILTFFICLDLSLITCDTVKGPPVVITLAAESVTSTTAMSGGIVKSDGDSEIMSRGVCWSTTENPSIGDSKTSDGSGIGSFASILTGLLPNTRYYAKAYATNSLSTVYGNQVSFVTKQPGLAILTTITVVIKSAHEVESGGNITDDGGSAVIERGVCWSTSPNPSIPGNSKSDGSGTGSYITVVNNLSPGTAYHIRAYAINGVGTSYGDELTFTTPVILPILQTDSVTEIAAVSAKSGGIITSDGGGTITAKGVCWNITTKPTLDNFHTSDGSGSASFKSSMTGLVADTRYFVRAYATNESGTFYGDERSFITIPYSISDQIIADHTVVEKFNDIPQYYIDQVKKMFLSVPGQSHSEGYYTGLLLLQNAYPKFAVKVTRSGTPEGPVTSYLRAAGTMWGDLDHATGWQYGIDTWDWAGGEPFDYTYSPAQAARVTTGLSYAHNNGFTVSAIGYGYCYNEGYVTSYITATQYFLDYCTEHNLPTKVFFTTGPADSHLSKADEESYNSYLRWKAIREHVAEDPTRILFDYNDILSYNDAGIQQTKTWNGHNFPVIHPDNMLGDTDVWPAGHIGGNGCLRLGKAMWWMLARIAGWDGQSK